MTDILIAPLLLIPNIGERMANVTDLLRLRGYWLMAIIG
jgi:hypothetical protein